MQIASTLKPTALSMRSCKRKATLTWQRTAKPLTLSPLMLQISMLRPHALAALQPITPEDFALLFPLPAPADLIGRSLAFCTAWADTEGQS